MPFDPPKESSEGHRSEPRPQPGDAERPPEGGPNWPVVLTAACYSTLALAAFAGVHQVIVIGCCYLTLAALVTQVHKRS